MVMSFSWLLLVRNSVAKEGVFGLVDSDHLNALIFLIDAVVNFAIRPVPCAPSMSHSGPELLFHSLPVLVTFNAKSMLFIVQESAFNDGTICPLDNTFTARIVVPVQLAFVD